MRFLVFKKFGWFYRPASFGAWLVLEFILALIVRDFLAIDRQTTTLGDTYYQFIPFAALYTGIYLWIGSHCLDKQEA